MIRFRPSTLIRYVFVYVLIHFQERFQIDAFSIKTLSVLVHVHRTPERIEIYASSTGPYTISPLCSVRLKKIPNFEWIKVLCGRSAKRKRQLTEILTTSWIRVGIDFLHTKYVSPRFFFSFTLDSLVKQNELTKQETKTIGTIFRP